jgi:hypothetical protein
MLCLESRLCDFFITTLHLTVANWSSLEACLQSVRWFNTLNHLKVIWSTEPIWNICIIRYFLSVINSNKQRSNETLVGAVFLASDLRTVGGRATNSAMLPPYSYSLSLLVFQTKKTFFVSQSVKIVHIHKLLFFLNYSKISKLRKFWRL